VPFGVEILSFGLEILESFDFELSDFPIRQVSPMPPELFSLEESASAGTSSYPHKASRSRRIARTHSR
jgi:hypothetical protein